MKTFQQLTVDQLFEILQLRVEVFVVEQQCPYAELEAFDRHAETRHLLGRDASGALVAYTRIVSPGVRYPEVAIGRFVVKAICRKQGIGHELLQNALEAIQHCWPGSAIRISAQEYIQGFYARYGFRRVSNVYVEDGIPHVEMLKKSS